MSGMYEKKGTLFLRTFSASLISPPIIIVSPLATRTFVFTSRFEVTGVGEPIVVSRSSTRCSISSATRFPLLTCGVTDNILSFCNKKWERSKTDTIDNQTFVNLIQHNKVSLYRLAKSIVKNEHEVEDAISETILKAFENLRRLNSPNSFKPWIMRILVNECYNILRKKKRIDLQEDMERLNLTYEDKNQNELLWIIDKLDEDLKTILILFYYEDMSLKEISEVLNISQGTVKSRLSRAKAKLKDILENQ